ncbi:MAG: hypothetical protein ACRCSN_21175 [Dermatophilaceae bacterium]
MMITAATLGAFSEQEFFGDYPLVGASQAWISLVVVAPLIAAWCAWDSGRLAPWLNESFNGRQRAKGLLRMLGPAILLTLLTVLFIVILASGLPRSSAVWVVTVVATVTMVAAAAFGAALGTVLPRLASVPVAVAVVYGLLAAPVANPDSWPARVLLTGAVAPCCSSDQQISEQTLGYAALMALSGTCGAVVVIMLNRTRFARGITLVLFMAGVSGAGWAAAETTESGGQLEARSSSHLVCGDEARILLCVWPEHTGEREAIASTIASGKRTADSLGIQLPDRWSEGAVPSAVAFRWSSGLSNDQHLYSLSISIAHNAGCLSPANEAVVSSAIASQMGLTGQEAIGGDQAVASAVAEFNGLPQSGRRNWMQERIARCRS